MKRFPLDNNYAKLLQSYGISIDELLKRAELPLDLFTKKSPSVTAEEYYHFMKAIEEIVPDKKMPILLATAENIETITPPLFAGYCSKNARECIQRIGQYKALVGAVVFDVREDENEMTVGIKGEDEQELPEIIIGIEMVLLTNLIRKATKEKIIPLKVSVENLFENQEYEKFLGQKIEKGKINAITFSKQDVEIPFITRNESMWNFLSLN